RLRHQPRHLPLANTEQRRSGYACGAALHREPGKRLALLPLRQRKQGSRVLRFGPGDQGSHRGRSADVVALETRSRAADGTVPSVQRLAGLKGPLSEMARLPDSNERKAEA